MKFFRSVTHAVRGIIYVFSHEQNFRIQIIVAGISIAGMLYFDISVSEKLVVIAMIGFVLTLELINTAIEKFLDLLKPRLHTHVAIIKDVMAAAVLSASCAALVVGLIIFVPYIIEYFL